MAQALDVSSGLGRREINAVRRRFTALAHERLQRILGELRPAQQTLLQLLPLLFHVNHPLLPGFVTRDTPAGISGFQPGRQQLELARRHCRSFVYRPYEQRHFPVQALYLMGSVGSIGQSRGSDLDLWLCHQTGLAQPALEALALKARRLEHWAAELGLEMHVFLMDADAFRRGERPRLSDESSGSTQHGLLLEEFYRSGLPLAGRPPLWWLVPPEQEWNYVRYTAELIHKRFVDPNEFLDLGGLGEVAAHEFFDAGLWQLFKGVKSPYKALLKILLMEAYAQGFPRPDWLACRIKQAVYAGELHPEGLDAYLLLYRQVEAYLQQRGQSERLELARRCLYFKVGEPLSRLPRPSGWRARILLGLVREWGWSQGHLCDLDERPRWKIDRVARERDLLVRELTRSYRLLSDFAAGHDEGRRVSPEELNLLGRQLYTALEQRPGKVERVNPGVSEDLSEPELSLHWERGEPDGGWSLYRGRLAGPPTATESPVKTARGLIELLAWCQLNGLTTAHTRFHLLPPEAPLRPPELGRILQTLQEVLPDSNGLQAPLSELAGAPYPRTLLAFVNLGEDPQRHLSKDGMRLLSDRSDPLSYGSGRRCLLLGLDLLVHTSWGELVTQSHHSPEGLLEALCFFLDLRRRSPPQASEPSLRSEGFATADGRRLAQRVDQVLHAADRFFRAAPGGRYVLGLDTRLCLLQHSERGFQWTAHATLEELLEALAEPRARYSPPGCDPLTLRDTPLPVVFRSCRRGEQQLFYHCAQGRTRLYILDESGSLFTQELAVEEPHFLLLQQRRFLDSLARLRRLSGMTEEAATLVTGARFHRLEQDAEEGWCVRPAQVPRGGMVDDYLELRLVAESAGRQVRILSLILGDREFPRRTLGEQLYSAVARQVLAHRLGGADYPLYLTAVELVQDRYGIPPSGVELLALKQRVERRLDQALRAVRGLQE